MEQDNYHMHYINTKDSTEICSSGSNKNVNFENLGCSRMIDEK